MWIKRFPVRIGATVPTATAGKGVFNPAIWIRERKHVVKNGKTPVLTAEEARALLDGIDLSTLAGCGQRDVIGRFVRRITLTAKNVSRASRRRALLDAPGERGLGRGERAAAC